MKYSRENLKAQWGKSTRDLLVGKKIANVRYMTDGEMEDFACFKAPVVITFTDGTMLVPQSDDEGNYRMYDHHITMCLCFIWRGNFLLQ